jgi:hypothetical protein
MTIFMFANNVSTTLAGPISSSATSLTLSSVAHLPASIPAGQVLVITLNDVATEQNFEVIYATAISGATLSGLLRGQEGTAALSWSTGDFAYSAPTAGQQANFGQLTTANTWSGANTFSEPVVVANAIASNEAVALGQITGGVFIKETSFQSSGTWTPDSRTTKIRVRIVGGGGGGGGQGGAGAGQVSLGGGGGAGAYAESIFTSGFSGGIVITIGAGGTGGASGGGVGGNGGTTIFGALMSAAGGGGGSGEASPVSTFPAIFGGATGATTSTGGNLVAAAGGYGAIAIASASNTAVSGGGGASFFGGGGAPLVSGGSGSGSGNAALSPGAGGGGALALSGAGSSAGGDGAKGIVIVEEFA